MKDRIQYTNQPPNVPRWFTYAVHLVAQLKCRKQGHQLAGNVCGHCGLVANIPPYHGVELLDGGEPDGDR
jgi:hypothetical protein